ncbi:MAG TPA: rRNA maturation RNase YbeY [Chitinophagales bacterium]|nr:rRNA maturation RNase YbeY [Chitinophagales bacterium]
MIYFHTEDVSFRLKNAARVKRWIQRVIQSEKKKPGSLNFIFCSDDYLLSLNRKYLKHDYYTDVLSFDFSNDERTVSGDVYISIDRVLENSAKFAKRKKSASLQANENELHRVMIHGVLHLLGYDDTTVSARKKMRQKEESCLMMRR